MDMPANIRCRNCESLRREFAILTAKVATLEAELAKAKKNSANSSKPPSSDIIKPPRAGDRPGSKRKRGAQAGHPRHERPPFAPEEINRPVEYHLSQCPDCGGKVTPQNITPRVVQQVDLADKLTEVSEHRRHACFCRRCQKTYYAEIPAKVRRAGLVGPRLTAVVTYLKGGCHCSFSTIRKFCRDVIGVMVCRGQLRKVCAKVSDSLDGAYDELLAAVREQPMLNVDETGHKEYKQRMWTWCFRANLFTLFKIDPSRSSDVLIEVLGEEFKGVLGCDYFSAYRKYMGDFNVLVQFCLAHLLRDIRFLTEHPDARNRAYGNRLLRAMRELFHVIHDRKKYSAKRFAIALQDAGDELEAQALWPVPRTSEAQNIKARFEKHGKSYLRFITTPSIEPTNNLVEQSLRFVVIDRLVTQGSRSPGGRRWLERIWSTMATCAQQGRSVFNFLVESVQSHFAGLTAPSLLPNTS